MISKIKKLLDNICEEYLTTIQGSRFASDLDIFENSPSYEIAKVIRDSYLNRIRFFMDKNDNYVIFDSNSMHDRALAGSGLSKYWNGMKGIIYDNTIYIYRQSAQPFYNTKLKDYNLDKVTDEAIVNEFKKSNFYKTLTKLNINDVVVGKSI